MCVTQSNMFVVVVVVVAIAGVPIYVKPSLTSLTHNIARIRYEYSIQKPPIHHPLTYLQHYPFPHQASSEWLVSSSSRSFMLQHTIFMLFVTHTLFGDSTKDLLFHYYTPSIGESFSQLNMPMPNILFSAQINVLNANKQSAPK